MLKSASAFKESIEKQMDDALGVPGGPGNASAKEREEDGSVSPSSSGSEDSDHDES